MTLQELYTLMDGDYEQAQKVLRIEKLIDKHIRRLPDNKLFADLQKTKETINSTQIFETAHAIKGICSNLGMMKIAGLASELSEEFRPGNGRTMSDAEVAAKISEIDTLFKKACEGIRKYEDELGA